MPLLAVPLLAALAAAPSGCRLFGQKSDGTHGQAAPAPSASVAKPESSAKHGKHEAHPAEHASVQRPFGLPFVREPGVEDPFDRARAFMRDVLTTNANFVQQHDAKFFKPFIDGQKPRATVVTCSDSRVQSPALDANPDNDLFTIRNIGNQIATSEGSVEYGIEHLHTPILLILGHSGCGAVKAALGDFSQQPEAIQHELSTLDLTPIVAAKSDKADKQDKSERADRPEKAERSEKSDKDRRSPKPVDPAAIVDGVANNVHHQVATALDKFGEQVAQHELIIVGAVYDFRNDLKKKHGTVHIINVNGHRDEPKISAFLKALRDPSGSAELASPGLSTGGGSRTSPGASEGREAMASDRPGSAKGEGPATERSNSARREPSPTERPGAARADLTAGDRGGLVRGEPASAERPSSARGELASQEVPTKREPTPAERAALAKAWRDIADPPGAEESAPGPHAAPAVEANALANGAQREHR